MKAAVIQFRATNNKERNIKRALEFVQRAVERKAKFILLPEAFNYRGKFSSRGGFGSIAETIPGPSIKPFMDIAGRSKVVLLAGSICEKVPGTKKVYNTSVLINASGKIAAKYRKVHLFDAQIGKVNVRESKDFLAGQRSVVASIGPWKIGLSICFDLRFADVYLKHKKMNVDIVCVPSAFTKMTGQAHWEPLLRARAIENMCYVLAPNQIGEDSKGVVSYGNSMIVSPWGEILVRASGTREEIIFAEMDKRLIRRKRAVLGFKN